MYQRPVEILQSLIRFDTTNPPGNEAECIACINTLLKHAGFETTILAKATNRTNLITRLKGQGSAPPLLLYGHVDVVTTAGQVWTHPPFEAKLVDGCVWGRGALDMKGAIAMMLSAILRAKAEGFAPAGDIVLAILSDEEAGGDYGARFLVENHPELFKGIRYAIGEFGGARIHLRGKKLYPIMVSEKQICWMKATVHGPGGHGSFPMRGGAMAKLAQLLQRLEQKRLPVHVTPIARHMIESMASAFPFPADLFLRQLLNPLITDRLLRLLGTKGKGLEPMFHNTVNATIVRGGEKINVIPSEILIEIDGRLLPGYKPDDMMAELRCIIGEDAALELVRHDAGPAEPDMGLFNMLSGILREADPGAHPFPTLLPGVTDGRHFSQLGIQTYGFTPMNSPQGVDLLQSAHAANERIPVESLDFGANAIYKALQLYRA
ncbi:MAG: M20/M25/M40 family metallo-hydrolase [Chloroflexi bacterium]|nr:M20/M25/M40 family metallo-hydrolase [Chloroflexota bacterium]